MHHLVVEGTESLDINLIFLFSTSASYVEGRRSIYFRSELKQKKFKRRQPVPDLTLCMSHKYFYTKRSIYFRLGWYYFPAPSQPRRLRVSNQFPTSQKNFHSYGDSNSPTPRTSGFSATTVVVLTSIGVDWSGRHAMRFNATGCLAPSAFTGCMHV